MRVAPGFTFQSTKTFTHSMGFSCAFRQWRAKESHCQFLHGYALEFKLTFQSDELDARNWVQDFGGLKDVKGFLTGMFDHTTVIAEDDPHLAIFKKLHGRILDLRVVRNIGCEAFAQLVFNSVVLLHPNLFSVEVREHAGNSAIYTRVPSTPTV